MGQKLITWIRLIMIGYIVPWWPSWLSDQTIQNLMLFEEFQDCCYCCHLGYWNGTILAILNFYVAPMPPIRFWLNLTSRLGDAV